MRRDGQDPCQDGNQAASNALIHAVSCSRAARRRRVLQQSSSPYQHTVTRSIASPRTVQLLLADASDVWPIAVSGDGSTTRRIVIPLVQAQVLWVILGELRTFDHNRLQGLIQQRGVVGVGSGNHNAQWAALSFHKQAPLAASLAAIRWVGSNQIPPNVPCPWPRLPPAIPSPRRPTLRTVPPRLPIFGARHPALKGAMDCAVVPQFFRQSVPLAPAAQAENDAVEHLSGVSTLAASDFRRVCLQDDRPNKFPKLVRRFPYGFQALLVVHEVPPNVFGETIRITS